MKKKTYAAQLSKLRHNRGLTQQQVADAIGITRGRLNNYEQGTREPDIEIMILLAEFYNVSIGCLLGRDETILLRRQENEIHEALTLLHKVKRLSSDKQKIIQLLMSEESASDKTL